VSTATGTARPGGASSARHRLAALATRTVNAASQRLRAGSGTVIGGRTGLALDPSLLEHLAAGRMIAVVSGTNGKTTTTRLLSVALQASTGSPLVRSNTTGSNMPAGHVAALAAGPLDAPAVLECDEGYLPTSLATLRPRAVVLLNLSRDQLDRTNEVRMIAGRWRAALGRQATGGDGRTVVANCDDPLVAWGAGDAPSVVWVAAGMRWRADAVGCPACGGRITFDPDGSWSCACGYARPRPDLWLDPLPDGGHEAVGSDGRRLPLTLAIPGRFNLANALMALAAAEALGVGPAAAVRAMSDVREVAGRFSTAVVGGVQARLMLAKNPAGWAELLELVCPGTSPVVVGINARVADGRDPSWLWDVGFEQLTGRPVVATGERCLDLSVRLRYGEVPHETVRRPLDALRAATRRRDADLGPDRVEFIGNYTAFHDLLGRR